MFFTKNLKNIRFKKKLFYKFTKFFKIKDVVACSISEEFISFFIYFFRVILYKCKYRSFNRNDSYKRKRRIRSKKHFEK